MNLQLFTLSAIMPVPVLAPFSSPGPAAPEAGCAGLFEALCTIPTPVVEASAAALPLPVSAVGADDATAMVTALDRSAVRLPVAQVAVDGATALVATLDRSAALLPGPTFALPQEPPMPLTRESRLPTQDADKSRSPTVETVPQAQPMPSSAHLRSPERSSALGGGRLADKLTKIEGEIAAAIDGDEAPVPDTPGAAQPAPASIPIMSAVLYTAPVAMTPAFPRVAGHIPANALESPSEGKQKVVAASSANAAERAPTATTANPVAVQPVTDFAVLPASSIPPETAAVDCHLDLARGDAWIDDLARDIAASAVRGGHLKFALAPETLGRLDVEVQRGGDGLNIHMAARNDTARDILSAAQPRLIEEIRAQGVRVVASDVSTGNADTRSDRAPRPPLPSSIEVLLVAKEAETPKSATSGRYA